MNNFNNEPQRQPGQPDAGQPQQGYPQSYGNAPQQIEPTYQQYHAQSMQPAQTGTVPPIPSGSDDNGTWKRCCSAPCAVSQPSPS